MPDKTSTERFVQLLTGCQPRLRAYIAMLLGDPAAADDVLQETNLVLWKKAAEFAAGSDFGAWACTVARFQVLAYLRDARRDRLVFDESLVEVLVGDAEAESIDIERQLAALRQCLEKLSGARRELIRGRYTLDQSIQQLAAATGQTAGSVAMNLSRARKALFDCIRNRLAEESP